MTELFVVRDKLQMQGMMLEEQMNKLLPLLRGINVQNDEMDDGELMEELERERGSRLELEELLKQKETELEEERKLRISMEEKCADLQKALIAKEENVFECFVKYLRTLSTQEVFGSAQMNDITMMKYFLEIKNLVGLRDKDDMTILHYAAKEDRLEIVKILIENGAMLDAASLLGKTPLHEAAECGHKDICKFLISSNAQVDPVDCRMQTPLHCAAYYGHSEICRLLYDSGAEINRNSMSNWTSLHLAARHGHLSVVKVLLECGADPELKTVSGQTSLNLSHYYNHENVAQLLSTNGSAEA